MEISKCRKIVERSGLRTGTRCGGAYSTPQTPLLVKRGLAAPSQRTHSRYHLSVGLNLDPPALFSTMIFADWPLDDDSSRLCTWKRIVETSSDNINVQSEAHT